MWEEESPLMAGRSLWNAEDNSQLLQPDQTLNARVGGQFTEPKIPHKITVEVDFVEFADGSIWGKDIGRNKEGLAAERSGAKIYLEYLQKVKREKGIQAVIKKANQLTDEVLKIENALIASETQNSHLAASFRGGMGRIKSRVIKAFKTNGIKAVEEELQKPFDLSVTN